MYQDSLTEAQKLREAIGALVEAPGDATLQAAREAWLAARVPYQQTEVYRFGNPIVDDWEGKVNAWPLDEGLIDYVAASYGEESDVNDLYTANVIASTEITASGETIDVSTIDAGLLRSLHEIDEVEANVATGYHAIEFLLWGQDLQRHRGRCRRAAGERFRRGQLHRRQLRPARRLSHHRRRHGGHRPRRRWSATGARAARRAPP